MNSVFKELGIYEVELDRDNPRIKMYLEMYSGDVTAEGVALALNNSAEGGTTFSSLKESIRVNKGLINPILVNHIADGTYVVIEGNTRLQIYRDFNKMDDSGTWAKIPALVYEQLSPDDIHAIRLQAHLVGPRDWDPYSKAKYLYQLSEVEYLPMETIISYCGGKRTEILHLIDTYKTMQEYYVPMVHKKGYDVDFRAFSKFAEAQKSTIQQALIMSKFTNEDFAKWVIDDNVDNAQSVRQLPKVLKDEAARKEFLKTGGKLTEAIKKLNRPQKSDVDLSSVPYDELADALLTNIRNISYNEMKSLKKAESDAYVNKRDILIFLAEELTDLVEDFKDE